MLSQRGIECPAKAKLFRPRSPPPCGMRIGRNPRSKPVRHSEYIPASYVQRQLEYHGSGPTSASVAPADLRRAPCSISTTTGPNDGTPKKHLQQAWSLGVSCVGPDPPITQIINPVCRLIAVPVARHVLNATSKPGAHTTSTPPKHDLLPDDASCQSGCQIATRFGVAVYSYHPSTLIQFRLSVLE